MKRITLLFSLTLAFVLLFENQTIAQTISEVFTQKFPHASDKAKMQDAVQTKNAELIAIYKAEFQKLDNALADIVNYENERAFEENVKVFELKELKRISKDFGFDELKQKITASKMEIVESLAATSRFGIDSVTTIENLARYQSLMKQKKYDEALVPWRVVFETAPKVTKNIYLHGVDMYEYRCQNAYFKADKAMELADKQEDEAKKEAYINKSKEYSTEAKANLDTVLMIYKQREKHFPYKGYIEGKMGIAMLKYNKDTVETAYDYLQKAIEIRGVKASASVAATFMQATVGMYVKENIKAEQVVENYLKVSDLLAKRLDKLQTTYKAQPSAKVEKAIDGMGKAIEGVDALFVNSGAANCEVLVEAFNPKYEAQKDNADFLKKVTAILVKQDCTDSELFAKASVSLHDLSPSATSAYNLAKLFLKKENYNEAAGFYDQAISLEEDNAKKAVFNYEAAVVAAQLGGKQKSRTYAREAIALKSDYGDPYILIAQLYASTRDCGDNEVTSRGVFWAAVDKLTKAKAVDPSVADKANKLIGSYSASYPTTQDAFFHGLNKGDSFTVGCWINETTTVRTR